MHNNFFKDDDLSPDDLRAARLARAKRWANAPDMHGYPALADEDETEATLAAEPPQRNEKRPKQAE